MERCSSEFYSAGKNTRKKSWSDLKSVVSDLRRQLSSLSTLLPTNITFRSLPDGRTRIYFLSTPHNGWETTLLYSDVPSTETPNVQREIIHSRLKWNQVLEPTNLTSGKSYTREEQLLFERKRLATWGITSYELHESSGKLVFPVASNLNHCIDSGNNTVGPLFPSEFCINPSGAPLNPQICPNNPDLVAYVSCGDIWVTHSHSGTTRLTYAHSGKPNLIDDPISAGIPSYVIQEEFSRYQGYWWQPANNDGIYRILYEEVDESEVNIYTLPSSLSNGETEEFRFPRPGKANAKSKLKLIEFKLLNTLQIIDVKIKEMHCSLGFLFPWCEYLVRVGWTPDSQNIWVQIMNRRQNKMNLILIPVNNFDCCVDPFGNEIASPTSSPLPDDDAWSMRLLSTRYRIHVLCAEYSTTWINIHDLLHFIHISDTEVTFIWASEESGFRHLYLITANISNPSNGLIEGENNIMECLNFGPRITNKVELTNGSWEVLKKAIHVDIERSLVYFMGLRETPLEKHLYVVSLKNPGHVRLLTRTGLSYSVEMDSSCTIMAQTYSNIQRLPSCQMFRIVHSSPEFTVEGVDLISMGFLLEGGTPEGSHYCPNIYSPQISSGDILYAMVFKPHNFKLGVKYPTVLNVYGGPEVQTVNNTFKGMRQLRMHMLAAQGYCVICVDSRGSQHRGVGFEAHLHCRMGTVELNDQVEVLNILAQELSFIDLNRVAIHGWSYGGYLSLMGLVQYPDVFRIAIAGAPVTSWELYDTGYTERYMDLPENNREGYLAGSVLTYIHKFPEEENRLLIIHGMIDENVHFLHTNQLVSELVRACKPYQLQVYPNERHSLRHLDASKHYETTLLAFLQNYL